MHFQLVLKLFTVGVAFFISAIFEKSMSTLGCCSVVSSLCSFELIIGETQKPIMFSEEVNSLYCRLGCTMSFFPLPTAMMVPYLHENTIYHHKEDLVSTVLLGYQCLPPNPHLNTMVEYGELIREFQSFYGIFFCVLYIASCLSCPSTCFFDMVLE